MLNENSNDYIEVIEPFDNTSFLNNKTKLNNYELNFGEYNNQKFSTKPTDLNNWIFEESIFESEKEFDNKRIYITNTQREENKEEKMEKKKQRKDNIFKQIKVKTIKFFIDTLNYHIDKINRFYTFKNNIKKDVKERLKKEYNLSILETTLEDILKNYCEKDFNQKVLNFIYENLEKKKDNDNLNFIYNFLKMKFIDIIQIFALSKEEFYDKFGYYNNFLLEKIDCPNKDDMKQLIDFGLIEYLNLKTGREIHSKKLTNK